MYGHTGVHGNEIADRLADAGSRGRVSPHATEWTVRPEGPMGREPLPRPPPPQPAPKRVNRRPAAQGEGPRRGRHLLLTCPKCQGQFRNCDLPQHEPDCRGPGNANLTCKYCHKQLGSVQARKNHERLVHAEEALRDGHIGKLSKKRSGT